MKKSRPFKKKQFKMRYFAFDFDGVISHYDGDWNRKTMGRPIAEVVKAVKMLRMHGHKIIIHSSRDTASIKKYCKKFLIPYDYINENPDRIVDNLGKPAASVYVDDRAYCYKNQKAEKLVKDMIEFQPYWKKR